MKLTPVTLLLLLHKTHGNVTKASKLAGRNPRTVYAALKRYGMQGERVRVLKRLR